MAYVRKRVPRYKDGGRVPVSEPTPAPEPVPVMSETEEEEMERLVRDADHAVLRAVKAQSNAEALSHERSRREIDALVQAALRQQPQTVEQHIDSLPGLSEAKRAFLKEHPELLEPEKGRIVQQRYAEGLRQFDDDSPELYDYLLEGVRREQEPERSAAVPEIERRVPPPAPPAPSPAPSQAPPPSIRRSVPITAPVSRDYPVSMSGKPEGNGVTLSREERDMAHLSYRDLSKPEAERLYAEKKLLLRRMRESGQYPERERG